MERHRVADAVRAWNELATINPEISSHLPQNGNLVINPGFGQPFLNGGFDWRITPLDNVSIESASTEDSYNGGHSLDITFNSINTNTAGILQLIPVDPGASYSLSLFYKAEELEGAHGISATVSDAFTGKPLVATDEILGSTAWQETSRRFSAGPSTALVSLELKRPGGTLIKGKLLIDDVRVVKE